MKYIYLVTLAVSMLLFSCGDEDDISVDLDNGKYFISDNPEGEVQKFIYDINAKYNTVVLTNPDTADYRYNFTSAHKILLESAVEKDVFEEELTAEENEILVNGFAFIKEVFLDLYTDEFKKENLPISIQLCDVLKKWVDGYDTITMRAYGSYKFMAISGINKDLKSISETEKKKYKADINTAFWYNHLVMGKASFNVPNSFYDVCKALYTEYYNDTAWDGDEEYSRQSGFLVNTDFGWFPEKEQDIKSYIEFIFKTSKADVAELLSKYPKIKLKYDILRTAILGKFKFDIAEINN